MITDFILTLALMASQPPVVTACDEALTDIQGNNSIELGVAAAACEKEGRGDDKAFLDFLLGIRLATDFTVLPPEDIVELKKKRAGLFRTIYGSSKYVDDEIARDPERFERLLSRVRAFDLAVPSDYDPGWEAGPGSKPALYSEVANGLRADQIALEEYVAQLVRDDIYYAAYLERLAMLAKISDGETELPARFDETAKTMRERRDLIGDPPSGSAVPWRKVYAPVQDTRFKVLHRGFNGAGSGEAKLFRTSAEVRGSWVADALAPEALEGVLQQVDFEQEVLGLFDAGEMVNATENFFVTEFGPSEYGDSFTFTVRVGVADADCGSSNTKSFPFALVKAQASPTNGLSGYFRSNYPDQCAPIMAGEPTPTAEEGSAD